MRFAGAALSTVHCMGGSRNHTLVVDPAITSAISSGARRDVDRGRLPNFKTHPSRRVVGDIQPANWPSTGGGCSTYPKLWSVRSKRKVDCNRLTLLCHAT